VIAVRVADDFGGSVAVSTPTRVPAQLVFVEVVDPDGRAVVSLSPLQVRELLAALLHVNTVVQGEENAL
jgi:hypothetical protein